MICIVRRTITHIPASVGRCFRSYFPTSTTTLLIEMRMLGGGGARTTLLSNSNRTKNAISAGIDNPPNNNDSTTTTTTQIRMKHHQAKIGQHLQVLDELAHGQSRKLAQERRQKKKDKKMAKDEQQQKKGMNIPQPNKDDEEEDEEEEEQQPADDAKKTKPDTKRKGAAKQTTKSRSQADVDDSDDSSSSSDDDDGNGSSTDNDDSDQEDSSGTVLPDPKRVKVKMNKLISQLEITMKKIRGTEPNPELFDDIMIHAYGSTTTLKSVAQVVISSPTLAIVTCYDPIMAKVVNVAIRDGLQLNPSIEESGVIRVPLPRISMETRQQTVIIIGKRIEQYRQKLRLQRRNVLEIVKQGIQGKLDGISKDDAYRIQKEIESIMDTTLEQINQIGEKKQQSIMKV